MRFTGATGRAYLFNKVVNLNYSEVQDRIMVSNNCLCWVIPSVSGWGTLSLYSPANWKAHCERCLMQELQRSPGLDLRKFIMSGGQ
jgi:hypothetical protein